MEEFAKNNQVIFVEHLGFARQRLGDFANIAVRLFRIAKIKNLFAKKVQTESNLTILTPLVLPPQNKLFNFINKHFFMKLFAKKLLGICKDKPIIWTYLATTTAVNLIKQIRPKALVYDCVYDALRHPDGPPDIYQSEQEMLKMADAVITDALYFYNHKKQFNDNVHQVPPGVDFEHFNRPKKLTEQQKKRMVNIVQPRICFFGCMGKEQNRIDLELMRRLAAENPQWSIINIGPIVDMEIPDFLKGLSNIHWLGMKPYSDLPGYLKECDVLILPYQLNDFTESIMPAKVFECLATGKPVVSTALPELIAFKQHYKIANSHEEFIKMVDESLKDDSQQSSNQRVEFARTNTWPERFKQVNQILEQALDKQQVKE
jgi:glycosyltransferase involved in cell wall biosynthesis